MNFLTSGLFWGAVIILFGLSILLKEVFNISFPLFRILFGCLIIYIGFVIMTGISWKYDTKKGSVKFGKSNIEYIADQKDYNIIFGEGVINLLNLKELEKDKKIEVNVIFGSGKIILSKDLPVNIELNAVFGSANANGKKVSGFGTNQQFSGSYDRNKPVLTIEANTVFGNLDVEYR